MPKGPGGVIVSRGKNCLPSPLQAHTAFFDGQNLFRAVRPGFGRTKLNYDVIGFAPAPAA
jgi:hypothetical protein